ncbi:MAG: radical SAM protein [Pseudomonadota bacterium]
MDGATPVKVAGRKFQDPDKTADGSQRARAPFRGLETLWVNTGTLCNIECRNCYIASSPTNDRLVYLTRAELSPFLDEAADMGAREIAFTGGEPFMNPDMIAMAGDALGHGFRVLILTNAMRPMMRRPIREALLDLKARYGDLLALRVSLDHHRADIHDRERGSGSFEKAMAGLAWLSGNGFSISAAGRAAFGENETDIRNGFAELFADRQIMIDASSPAALVLFPEMDEAAPVPEITEACWSILGKSPDDVMCSDARMLVKRKGAAAPVVLACTLIPYRDEFEMGASLKEAARPVSLNHPHCAKFCVLGGASCSA